MKLYKVLYIKEFGPTCGQPNAVYVSASYWRNAEVASEFYGDRFIKLLDDNFIEV